LRPSANLPPLNSFPLALFLSKPVVIRTIRTSIDVMTTPAWLCYPLSFFLIIVSSLVSPARFIVLWTSLDLCILWTSSFSWSQPIVAYVYLIKYVLSLFFILYVFVLMILPELECHRAWSAWMCVLVSKLEYNKAWSAGLLYTNGLGVGWFVFVFVYRGHGHRRLHCPHSTFASPGPPKIDAFVTLFQKL
jgi:hypothetical protein